MACSISYIVIQLFIVVLTTGINTVISEDIEIFGDIETRLYGGKESSPGKVPYIAFLHIVSYENETYYCGASIIDEYHLLTAAHCFENVQTAFVAVGMTDWCHGLMAGEHRLVKRVYNHPHYESKENFLTNDIAVLKVDRAIKFGKTIKAVRISSQKPRKNERCKLAGWGLTLNDPDIEGMELDEYTKVPCKLREANIKVVDFNKKRCIAADEKTQFCAGYAGSRPANLAVDANSCRGDSGGPLVCGNRLKGITSFDGELCSPITKIPTGFTKVSAYYDWINSITEDRPSSETLAHVVELFDAPNFSD